MYIVTPHYNPLDETVLMRGHKIGFSGEIRKITVKCLRIGTPKAINFPFVSNGKLMFLSVPIVKPFIMKL